MDIVSSENFVLSFKGVRGNCKISGVMFTGWGIFENLDHLRKGVDVSLAGMIKSCRSILLRNCFLLFWHKVGES